MKEYDEIPSKLSIQSSNEIILDKWQKEIIEYDGDILLCSGRQIGKTLTFSRKAAYYMLKNPKTQIIVVSLTEDQAKLIIMMILDYLEKYHKSKIVSKGKNKPTQNRITLKNKATVIARPCGNTADAVRGFTGDVLILDEASRFNDLIFTSVKPVLLSTGGQIWMCSTPAGKRGYFWEAYQNKNNRFKIWHKSSEEVIENREINNFWTEEKRRAALALLESERKDMTDLQYGQEYLGLFLEELRRFFDDELIEKSCILKRQRPSPKQDNYMGVDIARLGNDESAFEILNVGQEKKIKQIENITTKKQLTTETEAKIKELTKLYNCRKIGIDAGSGSLGVGIFDHLIEDLETKRKVVAMNNRAISMDREGKRRQRIFKEDLYDNFKSMLEHEEISLLDDDNLKLSLRSVQFEFSKDEGQRVTHVKIFGDYTHICEGLIRAAWLAKKERYKKLYIDYI